MKIPHQLEPNRVKWPKKGIICGIFHMLSFRLDMARNTKKIVIVFLTNVFIYATSLTAHSVAESYTVDRSTSAQEARAAGIPVVDTGDESGMDAAMAMLSGQAGVTGQPEVPGGHLEVKGSAVDVVRSREGSMCSSGEFSDHESQKIHQEYKVRFSIA